MLYFDSLMTSCTGSGTGTLVVSGTAPDGARTPQSKIPDGAAFEYRLDLDAQWETGIGYFSSSGTTLNRSTVISSSNSGALVSFSEGTKTLVVTPLAKSLHRLSLGRQFGVLGGRRGQIGPAMMGRVLMPGLGEEIVLDTPGWHCVARPEGARKLEGTITGGGAGGGGGEGAAASSTRVGGGGGGSSGTCRFAYRAANLPYVWVYIGAGGAGGNGGSSSAGSTGTSGEISYVCTHNDTTAQCRLATSGAAGPTGGASGTTGNPAGGSAGTASTDTEAPLSQGPDCLIYDNCAGQAGSTGSAGTGSAGTSQTLGTGATQTGGAGGGGVTSGNAASAGGDVTGVAACDVPTIPGGAGGATGTPGSCGCEAGLYALGGSGGGGTTSGTGALGGDGARGAGGGGGGAGTTTGGKGGKGGDGFGILIWS